MVGPRRSWLVLLLVIPLGSVALFAERAREPARTPLQLPAPILFNRAADAPTPVVFRHETHVSAASPRCTGCHPSPFRMLHPSHGTTHAAMDAGRSCGQCHDGTHSFATTDGERCETCHKGDTP